MQTFLKKRERVVGIGQDIGFVAQVIRRFAESRQHVLEEHLKALLGKSQAGGQRQNPLLDVGIELAQRPPCRFGDLAISSWRRTRHVHPIVHTANPVTLTTEP